jgi:hypothetical protein
MKDSPETERSATAGSLPLVLVYSTTLQDDEIGPASTLYRRNDRHEDCAVACRVSGSQMPCLRWHGICDGGSAGQAGPQDLPATLQAVSRQGPSCAGVAGAGLSGCGRKRPQRGAAQQYADAAQH